MVGQDHRVVRAFRHHRKLARLGFLFDELRLALLEALVHDAELLIGNPVHLRHLQKILRRIVRGKVRESEAQAVEFIRRFQPGRTEENVHGRLFQMHHLPSQQHSRALMPQQQQDATVPSHPVRIQHAQRPFQLEHLIKLRTCSHIWRDARQGRADLNNSHFPVPGDKKRESPLHLKPGHVW